MKIVGLIVLFLELISLTITLKAEMDKNNFTFSNLKTKLFNSVNKFRKGAKDDSTIT